MKKLHVTRHAVDRYIQRVDGRATRREARREIDHIAQGGKARPVPRRWMRSVRPSAGLAFVYSSDNPGVCLAVKDGVVVTVYSRSTCKRWQAAAARTELTGRSGRGRRRTRARLRIDLAPSRFAA